LHTAVWTGTEMIVWGGIGEFPGGDLNTGGRYNATTNNWTPTNTYNTPEPRTSHTAVWTGTEMVVWGGFNEFNFEDLNTGGRYNPNTDSWTATTTFAPDPRELHTAVWTGSEMIVWGGNANGGIVNTGGRYCAQGAPTPTPTPTPTATPLVPKPTPAPRLTPTPHPRP
jgi:N-acetylneuraminic acid mutarotase